MYKQLSLFSSLAAPALIVFTLWTTRSNRHDGSGGKKTFYKLCTLFAYVLSSLPIPNYSSFLWVFKERLSGCLRNTSSEKMKPEYYDLRVYRNQNNRRIYIFNTFFHEHGYHWKLNDSYGISLCGILFLDIINLPKV